MNSFDLRGAWDNVAQSYQEQQPLTTDSVSYGPLAPDETELQLLGNVKDLHILDIGCGGGHKSVALAKQGAIVTGIDISSEQIAYAQKLAKREEQVIDFQIAPAEALSELSAAKWDIVISTYVFHYIADIAPVVAHYRRVLRTGGRFIFSLDHPIRDCFFDQESEEDTVYPERSYFDSNPMRWHFGATGVQMQTYHRTISTWIELLHNSGFQLDKLIEPPLPSDVLAAEFPTDDPLAPRGNIPHTIIFSCTKR